MSAKVLTLLLLLLFVVVVSDVVLVAAVVIAAVVVVVLVVVVVAVVVACCWLLLVVFRIAVTADVVVAVVTSTFVIDALAIVGASDVASLWQFLVCCSVHWAIHRKEQVIENCYNCCFMMGHRFQQLLMMKRMRSVSAGNVKSKTAGDLLYCCRCCDCG